MQFLHTLTTYFRERTRRQIYRITLITSGAFLLLFGGALFYHYSRVAAAQERIRKVNRIRRQAQHVFKRRARVQKQQEKVDEILARDKTFKIKEYAERLIQEQGLGDALSSEPRIADPRDLRNGYTEIELDMSFADTTTQKIAELMYAFEQNKRMYIKEVVLTKNVKTATIDATLIVATLQQKTN